MSSSTVHIPAGEVTLEGDLAVPERSGGLVAFAHGSGSSRFSPRNNYVARRLQERGLATLLFDLLTREEDARYENRFDIDLLTERLLAATRWAQSEPSVQGLPIGLFGASTGAAAALRAAARMGPAIAAVVSRGGRPDLAQDVLGQVHSPTLLIVGGADYGVIELNEAAHGALAGERRLELVPGATHLFEEPGALEQVADLAADWLSEHLAGG
ncbi:MAG: alpha/beta hydrolase [Gammaproteobacteria bacterium]|nr:alpha/beta hydrolase [Gammaproteobacteria bacterium]